MVTLDCIAISFMLVFWGTLELLLKRRGILIGAFLTPLLLSVQPALLVLVLLAILAGGVRECLLNVAIAGVIVSVTLWLICWKTARHSGGFCSSLDRVEGVAAAGDWWFRSKIMRWQFWRQFSGMDASIEAFCDWTGHAEKQMVIHRMNAVPGSWAYELDGLGGSLGLILSEYGKLVAIVVSVTFALFQAPFLTHLAAVAFCLFSFLEVKFGLAWVKPLSRSEQPHRIHPDSVHTGHG